MVGINTPGNGKKVIKEIIFCSVEEARRGVTDLAIGVNNFDLLGMPVEDALSILRTNGLINGEEDIIVPVGLELTETNQWGGAVEYTFNDGFLSLDLAMDPDDEDEYIS